MSFLSEIAGTMMSGGLTAAAGGVTGLVGAGVAKFFDYKTKQLDIQADREKYIHEVEMKKADAEIMAQEWAARTKIAQVEETGKEATADAAAFATALTSEPQRYSEAGKLTAGQNWIMVFLDAARGLVRPMLTIYLCGITTAVYIQAHMLIRTMPADPAQAAALERQIVGTVLYLTTTCVLFWFGSRSKQDSPKLG